MRTRVVKDTSEDTVRERHSISAHGPGSCVFQWCGLIRQVVVYTLSRPEVSVVVSLYLYGLTDETVGWVGGGMSDVHR